MQGALSDYLLPDPSGEKKSFAAHSSESGSTEDECLRKELHEIVVPSALRVPWTDSEVPIHLHFYYIRFVPIPEDRKYSMFGLFVKGPLPREAESMEIDLNLLRGRIVKTMLVPSGVITFDGDEIMLAQNFQEMSLKIILDRSVFFSDFVPLGEIKESRNNSTTFYLLLPVKMHSYGDNIIIDWAAVRRSLASPIFGNPIHSFERDLHPKSDILQLRNGPINTCDILNSLVFTPHSKQFFFIHGVNHEKNAYCFKNSTYPTYEAYYKERGVQLLYPEQPFLIAKQLPYLRNLLISRLQGSKEARGSEEYFVEFPPELCLLKIIGFSKDIGSSLTLLPSLMRHLENFLVAIELKDMLSTVIPEGSGISADSVLQALTTEKCMVHYSLERFEVLGDAFLKYSVGRHSFLSYGTLDEGQLTLKREMIVKNSHLYELAIKNNLQVYIRDELFDPCQFYALGHPCVVVCNVDSETTVHSQQGNHNRVDGAEANNVKCTKSHQWLSRKTIADVVESLVGAFLVESGFKAAISFLRWIGIQVDICVSDAYRVCEESKSNMSLIDNIDVAALETLLGYRFQHRGLLLEAFVHSSYHNHSGGCYQRLEFLGDAALEYMITSYLYSAYPDLNPGQITDLKSSAVNNKFFAHIAVGRSFHLYLIKNSRALTEAINKFENFIKLSDSERDLLEEPACPKILGDIVESCMGAILLDTGFNLKLLWKIMLELLEPALTFSSLQLNHVRELQELCQCFDLKFRFSDPSKEKDGYFVRVEIDAEGKHLTCSAVNNNSKAAQRMAAQEALSKLKALGYKQKSKSLEEIVGSTRKEKAELIGYDEEPISVSDTNSLQLEESSQVSEKTPKLSFGKTMEASSTARSRLFEICTANHWSHPSFVLCREDGPSHRRMFTSKVIIEVETVSSTLLECFSEPKPQKKAAEEHAAEGALWYLKHLGYLPKP